MPRSEWNKCQDNGTNILIPIFLRMDFKVILIKHIFYDDILILPLYVKALILTWNNLNYRNNGSSFSDDKYVIDL